MSWSYSNNPAGSTVDEARFLIGDTNSTDPLFSDEEITYVIASEGGIMYTACAVCCETLARRYSGDVDSQMGVGTIKAMASQRAVAFANRAVELRKLATQKIGPYSAVSDPATSNSKSPIFTRDMMVDHYGVV